MFIGSVSPTLGPKTFLQPPPLSSALLISCLPGLSVHSIVQFFTLLTIPPTLAHWPSPFWKPQGF